MTPTATVGGVGAMASTNNYWMDMACMVPYSQKLLSLAIYDESKQRAMEFRKQYNQEQQEQSKDRSKAAASIASSFSSSSSQKAAIMAMTMMTDPNAIRRLSDVRIQVLDDYLRPSLIPNQLWSDIEQSWRYNLRIVAWARKEFLIGKYGPYIQEALVAYPQLRNSPQLSLTSSGGGNRRQLLLDLVHRGEINTDNIGVDASKNMASPFLQLPPSDIIMNAFRMQQWSKNKNTERISNSLVPIAKNIGGAILQQRSSSEEGSCEITKHIDVPLEADVSSSSLEDILEVVTKGYLKNCGPLNALCQEANFYQLYSREYVQNLGDYLLKRTAARCLADDTRQRKRQSQNSNDINYDFLEERPFMSPETVVLDIGAGDGVLMHCLRDYMERKVMGLSLSDNKRGNQRKNNRSNNVYSRRHQPMAIPTMVATDDMSWRIFAKADVEKLSVEQALEKYTTNLTTENNSDDDSSSSDYQKDQDQLRPQVIVICSWMPMGEDWTALLRKAEVDEYILIGEADDGSCGDNWLTWGNPNFYDFVAIENNSEVDKGRTDNDTSSPTPPYVAEGYQRLDMDSITKYQFSSFDLATSKSSKTVSFRRRKRRIA